MVAHVIGMELEDRQRKRHDPNLTELPLPFCVESFNYFVFSLFYFLVNVFGYRLFFSLYLWWHYARFEIRFYYLIIKFHVWCPNNKLVDIGVFARGEVADSVHFLQFYFPCHCIKMCRNLACLWEATNPAT